MSAPTLPKSLQAQASAPQTDGAGGSISGPPNYQDRVRQCQEFINKYKQLPQDFLRIPLPQPSPSNTVARTRTNIANQGTMMSMLDISVVEAQLVKNYGLLRMDLYCKIRVGHMVCETQTCPNGARNPKWDGVYQFNLKPGIDSFHLEIYDEKQFAMDEKIAWLYEPIPQEVFQGITVERWFPLSGRLGQNKEGSILLVISHKRVPVRGAGAPIPIHQGSQHHAATPLVFMPQPEHSPHIMGGGPVNLPVDPLIQIPAYIQPPPTPNHNRSPRDSQPAEPREADERDINQLGEMFPSIDKAIIKAILENNNHNKEAAIGALLAMG